MREFARQHDVQYWDLSQRANLTDADFDDLNHLGTDQACTRYTGVLTQHLGALLNHRETR